MNPTVTISMSGRVFTVDPEAYQVLKEYLDTLAIHYSNVTRKQEIIDDFEARLADLLKERLGTDNQIVSKTDVNAVIDIVGRPNQLNNGIGRPTSSASRRNRHLYRDIDGKNIGGVCSGLAYFWNVEPLLTRILFIIGALWGGIGAVFYVILWIAMPAAKTGTQKMEMYGNT